MYIYDPSRTLLILFEDDQPKGGYFGPIAERELQRLLLTDAMIHIGRCLTRMEILDLQRHKTDSHD